MCKQGFSGRKTKETPLYQISDACLSATVLEVTVVPYICFCVSRHGHLMLLMTYTCHCTDSLIMLRLLMN